MEILYSNLEGKFGRILSGICLTSIREENARISKRYDFFDVSKIKEMREDFSSYITNYLYLKGYENVEYIRENCEVIASKGDESYSFFVDFDWGGNDGIFSVKVLDKGVKCGISESASKFVFVISIEKRLIALLNCEKIKSMAKDKAKGVQLVTESDSLFKTQYLNLDLDSMDTKSKLFQLK